jgi:hypothetical protein
MEYFVLPRISLRGELNFFRLSGSDALAKEGDDRRTRNLSFFSNNKELNLTGTFNLLPLPSRFDRRALLNIYGFTGLGLLWMNPKTKYDGKTYALAPLKTEGVTYQRFQPAIPLGLGIRIKYRMVNSLIIEGGYRFLGTDYLDDVSGIYYTGSQGLLTKGRYPDPATLDSDLSRALSDRRKEYDPNSNYQYNKGVRGNPTTKDGYFLINVRLDYYLHDAIFISRRVRQIMRYR